MLRDATRRYLTLLYATWRYLTLFDAIRRYLTLFDAIRRYSTLLDAAQCYLTLFNAIWRYLMLFNATWRYSTLLDATRRYSMLLDTTRCYLTLLAGRLGRQTWPADLAGRLGRQTWPADLAGRLGRHLAGRLGRQTDLAIWKLKANIVSCKNRVKTRELSLNCYRLKRYRRRQCRGTNLFILCYLFLHCYCHQSFSDVRVRVRGLLWSPSPKISDFENPISDSDLKNIDKILTKYNSNFSVFVLISFCSHLLLIYK
jgi:hypothetical protein